jgi:hypothetical protein
VKRVSERFRWIYVAPLLAFIALLAWAFASPMGASPDDDFHLVSIWCASASADAHCTPGADAVSRTVPVALVHSGCFVPDPKKSAACQLTSVDFNPTHTVSTQRGNFVGGYPPVYYAVMGLFVGPNILVSVIVMRIVNIVVFLGLATATFALLPARRRATFVWPWLVTTIPLGIYLIPSNNPSSWAITGVGVAWIGLIAWFETTGKRRVGLGLIFALATLVAAGSRGDGAIYTALGIAVVLGLQYRPTKGFFVGSILPVTLLLLCAYFFISAQQVISGLNGFGGPPSASGGGAPDPTALIAFNLLNVPTLWAGVFGSWGLGWLEVLMPSIVAFGSLACFLVVAIVGFAKLTLRKAVAVAIVGTALVVIPVFVLTRGGDLVGSEVQPRYLLPLIIFFAGLLMLDAGERLVRFTRGQVMLVAITLAVVQFIALQVTMRRYVTGTSDHGWNLNANIQWWWTMPFSPMFVLIVGSIAYGALVWIIAREVTVGRSARNALLSVGTVAT